jgi:tRNA(Ile)-lysidine synthase
MERYNPRAKEALLRTARISADELDFIDAEADRVWNDIAEAHDGTVVLDRRKLSGLAPALKRHLLRRAAEEVLGSLKDIEAGHIEDIMAALEKPAGKELHLPGGLLFITEYDRCLLSVDEESLVPFPVIEGETRLNIPGETPLPGWQVKAGFIKKEDMTDEPDGFTAYLDAGKTGNALTVRRRRRGDRFYPLGIGKEKKLGEFMIDARIPKAWRDRVPVVCSPERIVWVAGWRIDDLMKVTPDTEKVLRLEFKQA